MAIYQPTKRNHAFTLIEMSIVLVIIGLIIGGILVGRDLIFAAQIRSQVSQITQISQALNTFVGKYNELPGDMCTNASKYGLTCGTVSSGRDNGVIDDFNSALPIHNTVWEPIYFFGHLVQAGLIAPTYLTGKSNSGLNCAATALPSFPPSGYYQIALNPQFGMLVETWQGSIWTWLGISDCSQSYMGAISPSPVLTTAQAAALDTKMDDGIPSTGRVMAFTYNSATQLLNTVDTVAGNCVTSAAATAYNIASNTLQCRMLIKLQQ